MAEPPKNPPPSRAFVGDSANFPTFKVNVAAPAKSAPSSPSKAQAPAPLAKSKGGR